MEKKERKKALKKALNLVVESFTESGLISEQDALSAIFGVFNKRHDEELKLVRATEEKLAKKIGADYVSIHYYGSDCMVPGEEKLSIEAHWKFTKEDLMKGK